jgi:hypothetical protein
MLVLQDVVPTELGESYRNSLQNSLLAGNYRLQVLW